MISHCRRTRSSLVIRQSLLLTSKYELHCRRTCLLLTTNTLFSAGNMNVLKTRALASATHTHSQLPVTSKQNCVKIIALVTATYLRNGCYYAEEIQKVSRCTTASLVGLNWSSRPSKQRKLQPNFCLFTIALVSQSKCGLSIRATPKIRGEKPQKSMTKDAKRLWRQFHGHNSPVVAHTQPQTRKGRSLVAEQSFGTYNTCIHTHTLQFLSLCQSNKERRGTKQKLLCSVFSTFIKVSRTCTVDLAIEQPRGVVCKLFSLICFVFHGAAPIPYVQVVILNLPLSLTKKYYHTS